MISILSFLDETWAGNEVRRAATAALPHVVHSLEEVSPLLTDSHPSVRLAGVGALPTVGGTRSTIQCVCADTDERVRQVVAETLPLLGGTLDDLYPFLTDPVLDVRRAAIKVLDRVVKNEADLSRVWFVRQMHRAKAEGVRVTEDIRSWFGLPKSWHPPHETPLSPRTLAESDEGAWRRHGESYTPHIDPIRYVRRCRRTTRADKRHDYTSDVKHFVAWLEAQDIGPLDVTRSDFIRYRQHLGQSYAKATATRCSPSPDGCMPKPSITAPSTTARRCG